MKASFLRSAKSNLTPNTSAPILNFNLSRVLFCSENHARRFQQIRSTSATQGHQVCWSNRMQTAGQSNANGWARLCKYLSTENTLKADALKPSELSERFFRILWAPMDQRERSAANSAEASPLVIRTDLSHCISPAPTYSHCNTHEPVTTAGAIGLPARYQVARLIPRASQGFWRLIEVLS